MGQPDDGVTHRVPFALVDAAVGHGRIDRPRFVPRSAVPSVEDHLDASEAGERPRQVPVELDGVGIQNQQHPANRPRRGGRWALGQRRQQHRAVMITDAVGVAGIVQRRPLTEEPRLTLFLTPRAPRLHEADLGAQVMPASDPNDGAALRPRVRGISLNREEVRQAGGGAASVDDVYVPPTAVARRAS